MSIVVPRERIEQTILVIRGQRVVLDSDLAKLYGVSTKALNQAVKRNADRFPKDFMFRLTQQEKTRVVTNCDHLSKLKFSPTMPFAFTEHGAVMVANVLNSERAVEVSIYVVRAFVKLREMLGTHKPWLRNWPNSSGESNRTTAISGPSLRPFANSWNRLRQSPAASDSRTESSQIVREMMLCHI
ncbi:MAG: ORF6N domain-containing protein [Terriglobia bacterium]